MSTTGPLLRLLGFVAIGAAWLIPDHYVPWSSAYNEAAAAVGLLFLAPSLGTRLVGDRSPGIVIAVLAVAAVPAAQYALGGLDFSGDAWVAALYLSMFAVAIAVGKAASTSRSSSSDPSGGREELPDGLAVTTLLAAALSALIAICQISHGSLLEGWIVSVPPGDRAVANLAQPNNLGTLIGLGAVALLFLVEQRRVARLPAVALLLLLSVGAALTLSRTPLAFGPLVFGVVWLARRRGVEFRTSLGAIVGATVLQWSVAGVWALAAPLLDPTALSLAVRGVGSTRLQMWPILIDSSLHSPWHGYGWLQVGEAELATVNRYPPVEELWLHGHNLFLELVLWCGYPLGLLLGALVVGWYVTRARCLRSVEATAGFCAITVFGFHALLELPHHYLYFLIPIGLWIGIVEAEVPSAPRLPKGSALVPVVLGVLLFVAIAKDYPAVEEDFRLMRFETRHIGNLKAAKPAPDAPFLSSLTAFLRFARSTPHAGMRADEIDAMEAITKRYPYGQSLLKLATALALNGREAEARERMISIRHMFDEGTYLSLRRELRAAVDDGRYPSLDRFEASLPDGRRVDVDATGDSRHAPASVAAPRSSAVLGALR